ncbi:hypothetical protein N7G274_002659 [Stereocaulon virgatum]|uniref:Glycerol transporter n=1 Tax=Stereocaulon virgatum TaxID=373712 RepID=A0ABR4AJL4_9LECA
MNTLQYAGRLFSVDTLDARFTSTTPQSRIDPARPFPNKASYNVSRDGRAGAEVTAKGVSPPRWKSPEFFYHALVFLVVVPLMFKTVYDVSKSSHPEYHRFAHLLSPGWIPGRMVDNSDSQYSSFRENVPYLFLLMTLHPLLRRLFDIFYSPVDQASKSKLKITTIGGNSPLSSDYARAERRLNERVTFDVGFSILFLIALHGFSAPKILMILYINYTIATQLHRDYVPAATWIFNIAILFANELGRGYPYSDLANFLSSWSYLRDSPKRDPIANWGTVLDSYGGLTPRWEILFNVTVLRLISFNLDYYWSLDRTEGSPIEKKQFDPANLSERDRVDIPAKHQDYSFRNYLAYTLYAPLYLAGPILTFNDYISQQRYAPQSIDWNRTLLYGIRFLICLLSMEVMIHFTYVIAISKAQPAWAVYTPFQLSMLGYFSLHHIWLKLLLPWRLFRLWSLLDGIDPPENVVRCMSDNYSVFGFWRGWHRSYNRWIIRYIYIPLGGSGGPSTRGKLGQVRAVFNLLVSFTFVAMWHDIQLRLLVWGWLISLFVLPETITTLLFPRKSWEKHKEAYRVICGIGAVGNILMMMSANLVGFAVGLDGLKGLVQGIVGSYSGLFFLAVACAALYTGVQIMFELREQELRRGIKLKC